jgi:hypothetical protein
MFNIKKKNTYFLSSRVVAITNINSARISLLRTQHEDKVVQRKLTSANLLLHGVAAEIGVGVEALLAELLLNGLDE